MRPRFFNSFRLASILLVLYTIGHTAGAVIATPKLGVGSDTVVALMKSVHVRAQGADCTWYGFYRGFGALVSVFFAFSAIVAWQLGGDRGLVQPVSRPIAWTLFASHLAGAVIAVAYFFPVPIVFASAITALLGWGCLRGAREHQLST